MSALSQPTSSSSALMTSSVSQHTQHTQQHTQPPQGSGSVSTSSGTYQLPPGAMPLPGMTPSGSGSNSTLLPQQYQQQQYPLTHSSPRQDPYYWNQY